MQILITYTCPERDNHDLTCLCQRQCLSRAIIRGVSSVDPPRDTVELDVKAGDLLLVVDLEKIESFDRYLLAPDCGEAPIPEDVIARDEDLEVFGAVESRSVENAVDVGLLAIGGRGAQLSYC